MKVIVLGCGWLGQLLLPVLLTDGHEVLATRRSAESLQQLTPGVSRLQLSLPLPCAPGTELLEHFHQAVVICAITPGWRKQAGEGYLASLAALAQLMRQAGSLACIHFSSTGVYQGLSGQVNEVTAIHLDDDKARLLYQGEQLLYAALPTCTLRLGGLIGPGRHPGRFIRSGVLADPDGPVNMIHSDDVLQAVRLLLQQQFWPALFNLCCPVALTRRQFYQQARASLGLSELAVGSNTAVQRRVLADAITHQLAFVYRYPSASDALKELL